MEQLRVQVLFLLLSSIFINNLPPDQSGPAIFFPVGETDIPAVLHCLGVSEVGILLVTLSEAAEKDGPHRRHHQHSADAGLQRRVEIPQLYQRKLNCIWVQCTDFINIYLIYYIYKTIYLLFTSLYKIWPMGIV